MAQCEITPLTIGLLLTAAIGSAGCRAPANEMSAEQLGGEWQYIEPDGGDGPDGRLLGMQAVHMVLLPSSKVLITSGSSWRNGQEVPLNDPRAPLSELSLAGGHSGLFKRISGQSPFSDAELPDYYKLVNNVGILDVENNKWTRIPHPRPQPSPDAPGEFAPNDQFCTGHLHLPNGNVLLAGGTELYSPYRTGLKSSFVFDWKKELDVNWDAVDHTQLPAVDWAANPWLFAGFMQKGRWYPHMVPLHDGRLVLFSGFIGFEGHIGADTDYDAPYQFEINSLVEFFDGRNFDAANPQAAWRSVEARGGPGAPIANSPFDTLLTDPQAACNSAENELDRGDTCLCSDHLDMPAEPCMITRRVEDYAFDAFKLYPHNYLLDDGRIYLTREGEWVSLRSASTTFMRRTHKTYFMNVEGTIDAPTISFDSGPERPVEQAADGTTNYGTTVRDPVSGDILVLGGQVPSGGRRLSYSTDPGLQRFAGSRGSRKLERYSPEAGGPGTWTRDENFLGESSEDDRTMHYTVLLPNKQILVVNGGNYDFMAGTRDPWLLTSDGNSLEQERMNPANDERLYHNTALLLPDGRVLVAGGNSARATVDRSSLEVDRDVYFTYDGFMATPPAGVDVDVKTEQWTAEVFSPPYLFIDPDRRAEIVSLERNSNNAADYEFETNLANKRFYLLHSGEDYTMNLLGLPSSCSDDTMASLVLIKLGSSTHGWDSGQDLTDLPFEPGGDDNLTFRVPGQQAGGLVPAFYMLIYVDCRGKPSIAQMVRVDDEATTL